MSVAGKHSPMQATTHAAVPTTVATPIPNLSYRKPVTSFANTTVTRFTDRTTLAQAGLWPPVTISTPLTVIDVMFDTWLVRMHPFTKPIATKPNTMSQNGALRLSSFHPMPSSAFSSAVASAVVFAFTST